MWEARKWYRTARWSAIRARQLMAQPLCKACEKQGRVTPARDVDHIEPHRGDLAKFWDTNNLQSLCPSCHGAKTRAGQ